MAIQVNTIDLDSVKAQQEAQFANEIERLENYIFAREWRAVSDRDRTELITVYEPIDPGFTVSSDHWRVLVANVKAAGYFMYRQWYHNGYYNETKIFAHIISKTPLTGAQLQYLGLAKDWGRMIGPGREQYRGDCL